MRASGLNMLMKCQGFSVFDLEEDRPVGKAAHTGTAVGRAIELYHRGSENNEAMNQVRREALTGIDGHDPFNLADWSEVTKMFNSYTEDARNPRSAVVVDSLEEKVTLRLDPHPNDPTGLPIIINGHTDQVRRSGSNYYVWDIKSGKADGKSMIGAYMYQQCAYTMAYKQKYPDRNVSWGGIIRTRGYMSNRRVPNPNYDPDKSAKSKGNSRTNLFPYSADHAPVHFEAPFGRDTIQAVLNQIRKTIGRMRGGDITITPGDHCRFCVKSGFHDCFPDLEDRGFLV